MHFILWWEILALLFQLTELESAFQPVSLPGRTLYIHPSYVHDCVCDPPSFLSTLPSPLSHHSLCPSGSGHHMPHPCRATLRRWTVEGSWETISARLISTPLKSERRWFKGGGGGGGAETEVLLNQKERESRIERERVREREGKLVDRGQNAWRATSIPVHDGLMLKCITPVP